MEINKTAISNPDKVQEKPTAINATFDEDLDKEYVDNRNIIISLIHNYSNYRKANIKVLGQRVETIGSSVSSCRTLSSNQKEMEAYMPALIGLSPNNPEFITRVKAYFSNIKYVISNNDATLNVSFIYKTKRDYNRFKALEDKIDEEYNKTNRSDITKIKEALKRKIEALNALESEKYTVGRPVNLEEYLLYRHCLLYHDVAKDMALINSDPSIRFYIKDEAKEKEKQKKFIEQRKKAMLNFIELGASEQKFNAVYIAIVSSRSENVSEALLKSKDIKENVVMDFVNSNPDKFNKLVEDKNIITKALIETLIIRGELVRSEYNQQISTAEGSFIGSNVNEAIAYFNNPANKDIRTVYENKLKML